MFDKFLGKMSEAEKKEYHLGLWQLKTMFAKEEEFSVHYFEHGFDTGYKDVIKAFENANPRGKVDDAGSFLRYIDSFFHKDEHVLRDFDKQSLSKQAFSVGLGLGHFLGFIEACMVEGDLNVRFKSVMDKSYKSIGNRIIPFLQILKKCNATSFIKSRLNSYKFRIMGNGALKLFQMIQQNL
ncbi:MAG: hypothetical protein ABIJ08_07030 [Nanoarchaeota archaeon]